MKRLIFRIVVIMGVLVTPYLGHSGEKRAPSFSLGLDLHLSDPIEGSRGPASTSARRSEETQRREIQGNPQSPIQGFHGDSIPNPGRVNYYYNK